MQKGVSCSCWTGFVAALIVSCPVGSVAWSQSPPKPGTDAAEPSNVPNAFKPEDTATEPTGLKQKLLSEAVKAARPVTAGIETWEARVAKSIRDFEQRVAELDLQQIDHQKIALSELRPILEEMELAANAILDGYAPFQTNFALYAKAVAQAPAVFDALADSYAKKAGEEPEDFAAIYADLVTLTRRLSARYRDKHTALLQQEQEVEKQIRFVRQSKIVLKDVRDLLDVVPITEEGAAVEAYIRKLNAYVGEFMKVIHTVKGTAEKIAEPKSSKSPGSANPQPSLEKRTTPLTKKLDAYKKSIATLRP